MTRTGQQLRQQLSLRVDVNLQIVGTQQTVNVEGTAPLLETGLAVLAATINQHRLFRSRHWAGHVSQPLFFLQALSRPQAIALECRIRAVANRGLALKPFSIDVAGAPPDFTAFGIHVRKLPIHIENLLALDENVSA